MTHESISIIEKGILPFESIVKYVYQRSMDQYRYLQKRFLDIGVDDTRVYRRPWDDDKAKGFDLNRVPYVKIELIKNNPLLTDLLLDIANNLPKQYTKKMKDKGKRKSREVKYTDEYELERASRVLVELASPTYQGYIKDPKIYLDKVASSINTYYEIMSKLEGYLRNIIEKKREEPGSVFEVSDNFREPIANPQSMCSRLRGINYNSVQPSDENVKPSGHVERRYFAARQKLLEHLAESLDAIVAADNNEHKFEIAKAAVEKGIKLKLKAEQTLETRTTTRLKEDKKSDNEFYVAITGPLGALSFEREPVPNVRMRDVYGRSFDKMKQHINDLKEYSRYLFLYQATAPRGKIKSNLIAIGPYGCGKTEMARAIASDPRFIAAEVNVSDALTCMFGEFEKNVDRVYDAARDLRRKSGDSKLVFLLMDEFDAWLNDTSGHWVDSTYIRVQKNLQQKLDGIVDYEGVITAAFTNEPKKIPVALYRRFKYVDIVGELEKDERIALLKHFLKVGLPLSRGFTEKHYEHWGDMLKDATGDVIGKVADDIHYDFMREITTAHPNEAEKLHKLIRRWTLKDLDIDKQYIKRQLGQYRMVTPDQVQQKIEEKLRDPVIMEQISVARRVYSEAREVMADLHRRKDNTSGQLILPGNYGYENGPKIITQID